MTLKDAKHVVTGGQSADRSMDEDGAALFDGPGKARGSCREIDWSSTSLGSIEHWPSSLRAAVKLCLDCPTAMAVWAGLELVLIHNESCASLFGRSGRPWGLGRPGHEVGERLWEWLRPELERACAGEAVLREDQPVLIERGVHAQEAFFTHSHTPIREANGPVVGVLSVFHETTGSAHVAQELSRIADHARTEAALRASEERFRALVTATSDVVFRVSPDWTEMRELHGRDLIADTKEPTTGWRDMYIHPEDQSRVQAAIEEAMRTDSTIELEHRVLRIDESVGWTLSRAIPLRDEHGEIIEWFGASSDVTERKRVEELLRESDRRKDEFLAMLGHELRNPLAAIRNATELMSLIAPEDSRLKRAHGVLERQSAHMTRLIDGLLEVSRIARGKIRLECDELDLREVIERVLEDRMSQIEARQLELKTERADQPLWVWADHVRLAQVVDNLVGNAIKFTKAPGTITILLDEEGRFAKITVRDTGVGIRPEMLESLFEPFQQERQEIDRGAGGLGLGLALSKGLVELHGGSIRAHSGGPGTGAEIVVRLPLTDPSTSERREQKMNEVTSRRVLIVEDNVDAGQSLRDLLEMLGHRVIFEQTGAEALEVMRRDSVDVVLCDLGLPGMSGYDLARAARNDPALRSTPLIALTGYGQPEDRQRTQKAGFDAHLVKPVDIEALNAVLVWLGE